tara:strand:+ start:292095 stop:292895 length:801 start_codon:yes stop_codon:yes gene_type:complete
MGKVFTEEEVKEIIRKAAEMQKQSGSEVQEQGLTMDELMEIGKESGLDVDFIKTAALEFENKKVTRHSGLTDTHIFEERTFDSELSESTIWEDVLSELGHQFGGNAFGMAKESKSQRKWSHTSISGIETTVSLTKRDSETKLKFSQRVGMGSPLTEGIMYGGGLTFLIMMLTGVFSEVSIQGMIALSAGLWSISSILIYQLDIAWRKRKLKNLKDLANKIIDQLPKKLSSSIKKEKVNENLSEIEIESEAVYQNDSELKNNLREKE